MTTRVYKYGAKPRLCEAILRQMRLGHAYYNRLVEAENARRREAWGGDYAPAPPHDDCEAKDCPECKAHWKGVRDAVRAMRLDLKPLRAAVVVEGLFWGTYLVVEQAFSQAVRTTDPTQGVRFRSWRQGSVAAVQIQKANPDPNRWWRMFPDPSREQGRTGRRRGRAYTAQIRLGTEGREPVWCDPIPLERHRPHEGRVAWVRVHLNYVADREVVSVHLVCVDCQAYQTGTGRVAIDASWRLLDGHLRVAWARDDDSIDHILTLPPKWLELHARADRIRAERQRLVNDLIASDTRLARCRSPRGVARVLKRTEDPPQAWVEWWHRDRHLWQYEDGCRRHSTARRRDAMRKWVAMLRERYGTAAIKDTNHKQIKERARENGELPQPARRRGHHGAPGELYELCRHAWGDKLVVVGAPYTSQCCLECEHDTDPEAATIHCCERCGAAVDRDRLSTQNMLDLWASGQQRPPTARKTTARFAKQHTK